MAMTHFFIFIGLRLHKKREKFFNLKTFNDLYGYNKKKILKISYVVDKENCEIKCNKFP